MAFIDPEKIKAQLDELENKDNILRSAATVFVVSVSTLAPLIEE